MHRRALNLFLLSAAAFVAGRHVWARPDVFAVHEWGTFTTLQGSGGGLLEGLHHEEERLPDFVHTLTEDRPHYGKGLPPRAVISRVTTKMETPVLYFHTGRPRSVRVHVGFEKGLLSQFYPSARLEGFDRRDGGGGARIDMSEIERTGLEWTLDLVPAGDARVPAVPEVLPDDPWQFAREVNCASVIAEGGEAERYVFYRGLGRLDLPIGISAEGMGQVTVRNGAVEAVPAAFLLEVTPEGGRFSELGALRPGETRAASFGDAPLAPVERVVAALRARVHAALVSEGLYEDEATAMVRTWSRTWFGSEGTRLLYVVPRPVTDAVLPLSIDPKPQELVRVLVGRLEFLTPETEREAENAFGTKDADRLARFGRFLEPVARRVLQTSRLAGVRAHARKVIESGSPFGA